MAWSAEQKAQGRAELVRRRATETASTRRASFLKWFAAAFFFALTAALHLSQLLHPQSGVPRISTTLGLIVLLLALAFCAALAYVRFLDWRRTQA